MILAALLVQTVAPPQDDIVVLARKLRMIGVAVSAPRRNGRLTLRNCRITRPSGIAALDAIPCEVAQQCIAEAPDTRKALGGCIEARSKLRLDAIVAERRGR